ncbi:hypothetical protein GA0074695_2288 [Micromonospora viridifaciens]|uniref:Abortive infection protein n=1 Tax=Micromonospora viridifaciens TaxID=1881 RepID=A0A1C4WC47_MICVI|nr:hypothetical protein [Micromonospora viridifaciens]SCE93772.1 hypothetical protein GA0074695_2288 [Micromonospora viridifaciens]
MRNRGITYDTGWAAGPGPTTHEPFDPETVRRDLWVVRDELHCTAVRVTGSLPERLEVAARHAADAGLEVWFSPFTNDLTTRELLDVLTDCAERAERLRRDGAEVVLLTGAELTLFTRGFLPGDTLDERLTLLSRPDQLRELVPTIPPKLNAFLAEAAAQVRKDFGGRISYAALPSERVDWTPFDFVGVDLYRSKENADVYEHALRVLAEQGKPVAVTEFGCTTYRGAADLGARGAFLVDWDGTTGRGLTQDLDRDEEEQARYLRELVEVYQREAVDSAFWCTFAARNLPHRPGAGRADLDVASYGLVKVLDSGQWEPKAAFHAMAEVYAALS